MDTRTLLRHRRHAAAWRFRTKRALDLVGAACALVLAAPLLVAIAVLVRATIGRSVVFSQLRPGMGGVPFKLYKFRTMSDARDGNGVLLPDALRLGAYGKILRSTSLDELPELWNVLVGEMSFVGPRPLLMEYLPLYSSEQARRHEVRPGITGWAQVNGRNALSWEERFKLDIWYVDHHSIRLDLKILLLTVVKVVSRDGISAAGEATMPKFTRTFDDTSRG